MLQRNLVQGLPPCDCWLATGPLILFCPRQGAMRLVRRSCTCRDNVSSPCPCWVCIHRIRNVSEARVDVHSMVGGHQHQAFKTMQHPMDTVRPLLVMWLWLLLRSVTSASSYLHHAVENQPTHCTHGGCSTALNNRPTALRGIETSHRITRVCFDGFSITQTCIGAIVQNLDS